MSSFFGSSSSKKESKGKEPDASTKSVRDFVKEQPTAIYEFSTDDNKQRAELCRRTRDGVSCIKLDSTSKKMFELMQGLGFFCALPPDPDKTHMECKLLMPPSEKT